MDNYKELADWDEGHIELSVPPQQRVTLNTMHGTVTIDVRADDVNAFVFVNGERKDFVLLRRDPGSAEGSR